MKTMKIVAACLLGVLSTRIDAQSGSLRVTGNHQHVAITDSMALTPSPHFTIEMWCKWDGPTLSQGHYTLLRKPESPPSYLLRLNFNGTQAEFYTMHNQGLSNMNANLGGANMVGQWQHLAGSYDGQSMRVYLNGNLIGTSAVGGQSTVHVNGVMRLGDGTGNENSSFNGLIDEVRLWNYARSAAEIQSTRQVSLFAAPGLVSCWKFDGNFTDSVGPHHGSPIGGAQLVPENAPTFSLAIDAPTLVIPGGPCAWELEFQEANQLYVFDVSFAGSSPGIVLPTGLVIPINRPLVSFDWGTLLPPGSIRDFVGTTGSGPIFPVLLLPNEPAIAGLSMTAVGLVLEPSMGILRSTSLPSTTGIVSTGPTVSAVVPSRVPEQGGTPIQVTGEAFTAGSVVRINGVNCPTNFVSPTQLQAVTPPSRVGTAVVSVVTPSGVAAFNVDALEFQPTLRILGVDPPAAPAGSLVTVTGEGIQPGSQFSLSGTPALASVSSLNSATFTVPNGVACDAQLVVTTPSGQVASVVWNATPTISYSILAQSGPSGGSLFMLVGNFQGPLVVTVGGQPAPIVSRSSSVMIAVAPPGSIGTTSVVVSSSTGCSASAPFLYQ